MKSLAVIYLLSLVSAVAEVPRAESFADAFAQAKTSDAPVAVYVHGSSWHPASKTFASAVWRDPEFEGALMNPVILTDIHVGQALDKEAAKAQTEKYKPWNAKTVRSFPAIQIYAPDGHLLKSIQGGEFRQLRGTKTVASAIDEITIASAVRSSHLVEIARAREAEDRAAEAAALAALEGLPINPEPKYLEQLKAADPEDSAGLQAKIGFKNWWFVREINGLINEKKTDEALARIDEMLKSPVYLPEQRVYIIGARGNVLVALDQLDEAWKAFQQAHGCAPDDPNAIAMLEHGRRVAGIPSRKVFAEGSPLESGGIGDLLTGEATFTMSSAAHDDPANHASLFKGQLADHAFHTASEKGAHIVIDLGADCQVKAMRIMNRRSSADRAKSLCVWHSTDGETWSETWQSEAVEPSWEILLATPAEARYLKVGLAPEVVNFLHLRAVDVYGERS